MIKDQICLVKALIRKCKWLQNLSRCKKCGIPSGQAGCLNDERAATTSRWGYAPGMLSAARPRFTRPRDLRDHSS